MAERYSIVRSLGEGSFGKCFLVQAHSDHSLYVIKQIDLNPLSKQEQADTLRESKILEQLDHPNIVKFKEVYKTRRGKLCIVMEYADGGDMATKVRGQRGVPLDEGTVLDYFVQICLALKHVHDRKILHRDLKSQNIFLMKNGRVKLGDFGIAKVLSTTRDNAQTMVGTPYYLSPEIVQTQPYSFKSDIWSLGVLLYEMCMLRPPFEAQSIHGLAVKIVKAEYQQLPSRFSQELRALLRRLLGRTPEERPTIHEVLFTPIIQRRIVTFLTDSMRKKEFSHTIMHGRNIFQKPVAVQAERPPSVVQMTVETAAESLATPEQNQMFLEKLNVANVEEQKRVELLEDVKRKQLAHTAKKHEIAEACAQQLKQISSPAELTGEQAVHSAVATDLDNQAQIYELQRALLEHPSEAEIVEMQEPVHSTTERDDDIPENTSQAMMNTSGLGKIEAMRMLLEDDLGVSAFFEIYRIVREIDEDVQEEPNSELYFERLHHLLTYEKMEVVVPQIQVLMDLERSEGHYG